MNRIILALSTSISAFFVLSAPGFSQGNPGPLSIANGPGTTLSGNSFAVFQVAAAGWIFADGFEVCACDDDLECTHDFCVGLDACEANTFPTFCLIGEACWALDQANPSNPCLVCDPSIVQDQWTAKNGLACNDGDPCTSGDICSEGTCSGSPTQDQFESNNTFENSHYLGETDDASDWPEDTFDASLYPSADVDWFRFSVTDDTSTNYVPTPKVSMTNIPTGVNYNLCAYYQCLDPGEHEGADCILGSATSYNGHPGCCSTHSGTTSETVQFRTDCDNGGFLGADDETGDVLIRIYRASINQTCGLYHVEWGDDRVDHEDQ